MVSGTTLVACLAAVCLTCPSVSAWGGLFNRFNPSMLSNLGYGGQGGNYGRELFGVADKNFGEVNFVSNFAHLGGRIAQWTAFSLCTQRPWVQFLAFPRNFLDVAEVNQRGCCLKQWTAEA